MSSERDYRAEALTARRAARSKLLEFRKARLAAKSGRSARAISNRSVSRQDTQIAPESFFLMDGADASNTNISNAESRGPDALDDASPRGVEAPDQETSATIDVPATGSEDASIAPDSDVRVAPPLEPSQAPKPVGSDSSPTEVTAEPADIPTTGESAGDLPPDDAVQTLESDLFELPGAGAGIVWMFEQCGIRSLSDLANADARELSAKLGVVGHILNVQPWIVYASEARGKP